MHVNTAVAVGTKNKLLFFLGGVDETQGWSSPAFKGYRKIIRTTTKITHMSHKHKKMTKIFKMTKSDLLSASEIKL